jgi:large subunit ribosomal protein L35e
MVEKQVNKKIRDSDVQVIRGNIDRLKEELRNLRNAKASSGSASKLAKIKGVRKNIARNLTILNEKERKTVAGSLHKGSSKRAQFLRTKLTRSFRRQLTTHQKSKQIAKIQKKATNFPTRKYGLRA